MARYKFNQYFFDTRTLLLNSGKKPQALRPKTALLLKTLLLNRDRVMTKKELFIAVWQNEHTQDHTLFQLVSEIRKLGTDSELIRTQPNIGYQWVATTTEVKPFNLALVARVACIGVLVLVAQRGISNLEFFPFESSTLVSGLPAIRTYSKGVVALEENNYRKAESLFRVSLEENPSSQTAQLLLAEALYQQQKLDAAEAYVQLIAADSRSTPYIASAALDLLSRIYQQRGMGEDALIFAKMGVDQLSAVEAMCSVEVLETRIRGLSGQIDKPVDAQVWPSLNHRKRDLFTRWFLIGSRVSNTRELEVKKNDACSRLKKILLEEEVSDCRGGSKTKVKIASYIKLNSDRKVRGLT